MDKIKLNINKNLLLQLILIAPLVAHTFLSQYLMILRELWGLRNFIYIFYVVFNFIYIYFSITFIKKYYIINDIKNFSIFCWVLFLLWNILVLYLLYYFYNIYVSDMALFIYTLIFTVLTLYSLIIQKAIYQVLLKNKINL